MPEKPAYEELEKRVRDLEKTNQILRAKEKYFREIEDRYRLLAENSLNLIYRMSLPDGIYEYVSPAATVLSGYSPDEWYHHPLLMREIIHPDWRQYFDDHWARLLEGDDPAVHQYRIVHKNGSDRWISQRNVRVTGAAGGSIHIEGVVTDITDFKVTEERFNTVLQKAPLGITIADGKGRFLGVSGYLLNNLGYTMEEIRSLTFLEITHPEDYEQTASNVKQVRSGESDFYDMEKRYLKKDGGVLWSRLRASAFRTPNGDIKYWIGIIEDITEQKRALREKLKLEEQLFQSQKMESIGRLAGGVAHDLNNLLSPILGYAELLLLNIHDEQRRGMLELIVKAGTRAGSLVRQLLAFSRKQTLEFRSIDLNTLLVDFEKLLRRTIREDVAIHVSLDPSIPPIRGDAGQLEQVIMNLAVNSQDAMPGGGKLTFETARVFLDETYAAKHEGIIPGPYVMLAVNDTGDGMDKETQDRMFEPFFTTKEKGKGTGLGLSTVYGIVKQHEGNIWVYSEPGLGTTLKIYLPVADGVVGCTDSDLKLSPESNLRGSETILLVEDNDLVRELALAVLVQLGYRALVAKSGKDALARLAGHGGSVDLLLTDVVMPEMNGKQLYGMIAEQYPSMRVLYMSGYTDNVIAHHGIVDEGVNFIQKPFNVNALAAKVREVLDA